MGHTVMYKLTMFAYCGMPVPIGEGSLAEMQARAVEWRRLRERRGYVVSQLKIGREWEIEEPEFAGSIPDDAGILSIDKKE